MVDGNDIVGGEGPMAPTRCGSVPAIEVAKYTAEHGLDVARAHCMKTGGFVDLLGTSDAIEVCERAAAGDKAAARAWDAMVYQICKWIGEMACVLKGDVDGILLGGGMVHSKELVASIEECCSWSLPYRLIPASLSSRRWRLAPAACSMVSRKRSCTAENPCSPDSTTNSAVFGAAAGDVWPLRPFSLSVRMDHG